MTVPMVAFIARSLSPRTKYLLCSSIFGPRGTSRAPRPSQQPEQRYAPYGRRHGASGGAFGRRVAGDKRIPEDPPRDVAHSRCCRLIPRLTEGPSARSERTKRQSRRAGAATRTAHGARGGAFERRIAVDMRIPQPQACHLTHMYDMAYTRCLAHDVSRDTQHS